MLEFLPAEIREGLERARRRAPARRRKLALHLGDAVFPILRLWDNGFAVEASRLNRLRGFVEIHEGSRPLLSCLIVASDVTDAELICTFKRATPILTRAALDYELPEDLPVTLLPRN